MSSDSFKNVYKNVFTNNIYSMNMDETVLDNLQWLIPHKT